MTARAWLRTLLLLAALGALLAWLLPAGTLGELPAILGAARPLPLLLAALSLLASVFLRALRLHVLLARGRDYPDTLLAHNVGAMVNCLLPLRTGELCMAMLLGRRLPGGAGEALARLFVDRLLDFLVLAALCGGALLASGPAQEFVAAPWRILGGAALLLLLAMGAGWLVCSRRQELLRLLEGFISGRLGRDAAPWLERADGLIDGARSLLDWRRLLMGAGLSAAGWAVLGLNLHWCLQTVTPTPAPAAALLGLGAITMGLIAAPLPSGLGATHGAIVLAYGLYGVGAGPALAGAVIYHAMGTALALLLGFVSLQRLGLSLDSLVRTLRPLRAKSD